MLGIDGIRIAQPGFDLGHRQPARPRLDRRRGRGPRQARAWRHIHQPRGQRGIILSCGASASVQSQAAASVASAAAASARRWWARHPPSGCGSAARTGPPPAWRSRAPTGRCCVPAVPGPGCAHGTREPGIGAGALAARRLRSSRPGRSDRNAAAALPADPEWPGADAGRTRRAPAPSSPGCGTGRPGAGLDRRQVLPPPSCSAATSWAAASPSALAHRMQFSLFVAGQCFRGRDMGVEQIGQRRFVLREQSLPAAPGLRRSRSTSRQRRQRLGGRRESRMRGFGDGRGDAGQPRIGPRAAQAPAVQFARAGAESGAILAAPRKGMLQQRQQRHRREARLRRLPPAGRERCRRRCAPAGGRRNRRWRCSSAPSRPPPAAPGCGPASPARRCGPVFPAPRARPARWPALPAPDRRPRPAPDLSSPAAISPPPFSASARQASVVGAGRKVSLSKVSRAGLVLGVEPVLHILARRRRWSRSNWRRPNCGWPGSSSSQLSSSSRWSSPGSTTAPLGRRAITRQQFGGGGNRAGGAGGDHQAWRRRRFQPLRQGLQAPGCAARRD